MIEAVQKNNVMIPTGDVNIGNMNYSVNANGMLPKVDDFNNIVIKMPARAARLNDAVGQGSDGSADGSPIFLKDIGYAVNVSAVIFCPRKKVADYSANPDNAPKWYVNIKSAECLPAGQAGKTPKPLQVGSQIAFTAHFLGEKLAYTYEIVELIPGEKLVMRTAEGPFPMETTYIWESVDEKSTRMNLRNRGNPTGFSRIFAPLMAAMIKRANKKDLTLLKQILENTQ